MEIQSSYALSQYLPEACEQCSLIFPREYAEGSIFQCDWKMMATLRNFCAQSLSCVRLCSLPGSSVHGISRQEYWRQLPFPPLGVLPNPSIEPASPVSPALAGRFFTTEPPGMVGSQNASINEQHILSYSLDCV